MEKIKYLYKINGKTITKEQIVAKNTWVITTKDNEGNYISYHKNRIDSKGEVYSHIILAWNEIKNTITID